MGPRRMITAFLLNAIAATVVAQNLSCIDIPCPVNRDPTVCSIQQDPDSASFGNVVYYMEMSKVQTSVSNNPLSWTIAEGIEDSEQQEKPPHGIRQFYLGQPAPLDLRLTTNFTACALFFEGVAPELSFSKSKSEGVQTTATGNCSDAWTSQCVQDMTLLSEGIAHASTQLSMDCGGFLQQLLRKGGFPESCKKSKQWNDVVVKTINGPSLPAPVPVNASDCDFTGNSSDSVTKIFTWNTTQSDSRLFFGVMPVMTVLLANGESNLNRFRPEVHLSCLKPIDATNPQSHGFTGGSTAISRGSENVAQIVMAIALLFWLI